MGENKERAECHLVSDIVVEWIGNISWRWNLGYRGIGRLDSKDGVVEGNQIVERIDYWNKGYQSLDQLSHRRGEWNWKSQSVDSGMG